MKLGSWLVLGLLASNAYADLSKTGGGHPTVKFQAECQGYSLDTAKQQCFNLAIEQVVGQVIVSDLESSGDRIIRDTIGQYSAGYVDNYVIHQQTHDEHGWYHLKMTVTVASSKIAQRKLSRGERVDLVNGDSAMTSIESQLDQREKGDALITQVLASYPENAYIINSGQTEFRISNLRQSYVEIPYSINMNRQWLDALNEALGLVAVDANKCNSVSMAVTNSIKRSRTSPGVGRIADAVCGRDPDIRVMNKSGFFSSANVYYFADIETLHIINNELRTPGQQHIGLRVDLLDAGGNIIDSRCARINNERFIHYERPVGTYNLNELYSDSRPNILGQNNVYGTLQVSIKNVQQMKELAKIKLNIQRTCA
jgi:hypothetical protein